MWKVSKCAEGWFLYLDNEESAIGDTWSVHDTVFTTLEEAQNTAAAWNEVAKG